MSVSVAFAELVATLDNPSAEVQVLVQAGHALAVEIDVAQLADDNGKTRSASAAVTALRGLVDDLMAKGRAVGRNLDEDWIAPTLAAIPGPAATRDAPKSAAGNARPRGGRGGKAVAQAVDAVAATRRGRSA